MLVSLALCEFRETHIQNSHSKFQICLVARVGEICYNTARDKENAPEIVWSLNNL